MHVNSCIFVYLCVCVCVCFSQNVAINAKRIPNAQFMACWRRTPSAIRFMMVKRGENNRAYSIIPTFHGALAMACIALAYIYWAAVLIPRTWQVLPVTHAFLIAFTIPMYYCYYKSWKGDPGTILPQPEQVIQGFISEELAMEDIIMVAMSPKYPRAKYSRYVLQPQPLNPKFPNAKPLNPKLGQSTGALQDSGIRRPQHPADPQP